MDRSKSEHSHDNDYWSIVAEFIERRDRGEPVDPAEFAAGDPILAKRLEDCLAGFGWLEHALSGSGEDGVEASRLGESPPASVGDYNIVREIGRGGMGVVYEAVHQSLGRRVALKVLLDPSVRGKSSRDRFIREARTAASLHHTNIVPVFDVGTAGGHLYFAMQLIDGGSLEQLTADTRTADDLTGTVHESDSGSVSGSSSGEMRRPRNVARLGLQAAEALAYAHARGVVHRDIKPSNLILDSTGTLWVTDFGLARRADDTTVTASGARVGTPRYMSPEQATAQWKSLDARTDIYSLGVTLYELLTGRPLFVESTPQQLLFQVLRSEPVRPRRLNSKIPRDLETIVLKAIAKRPADRYWSAQEFADDLRRFLAREPVHARRIGLVGRAVRWCQREPLVAGISLAAATLVTAIAIAYQVDLTTQRDVAIAAGNETRAQLADALFERARALRHSREPGRRWMALESLRRSAEIRHAATLAVEATAALQQYDVRPTDLLASLGGPATAVAIHPPSNRIAVAHSANDSFEVALVDARSRSVSPRPVPEPVHSLIFSSDARYLAGTTDNHVCLWDLEQDTFRALSRTAGGLTNIAFDRDGARLFGFSNGLCVWNTATGEMERLIAEAQVEIGHTAVGSDGSILLASMTAPDGSGTQISRWSLPDQSPLAPMQLPLGANDPLADAMGVLALASSPSGDLVAASYGDSRIRLWDCKSGRLIRTLSGHRAPAVSLAFLPDGERLVSTDRFEMKLWDTSGGELGTLVHANTALVGPLPSVAAGNGLIVTAGDVAGAWELAEPQFHRVFARQTEAIRSMAVSGGGERLAWGGRGRIELADWVSGQMRQIPTAVQGEISLAFLPRSNRLVAVGTGTAYIELWDVEQGSELGRWPAVPATAIAAAPDGRQCAIAHADNVIRSWDVTTRQANQSFAGHRGLVACLAVSPDGKWLAAGSHADDPQGATLHVWEVATGRVMQWQAHRSVTFGLAFSPDSSTLVSCGGDQGLALWDVTSGRRVGALTGGSRMARQVAWSPDGSLIAASYMDDCAYLWDARSGTLLGEFTAQVCDSLASVAFSADGGWLVVGGGPYRWTHDGPGALEAWNLNALRGQLQTIGLDWQAAGPPLSVADRMVHER